ncbi:MAG: signal peptidase I [Clostridia bacterium]|nr:signal peptidase I [Clostridia bacterium]
MKRVITGLINGICIIVIVFLIAILFSVVTTPAGENPNFMGFSAFRIISGSMEPALPVDSFVLVKGVPASELQAGDIISFYSRDPLLGGAVNTHRIDSVLVENGLTRFVTKGDANAIADAIPVEVQDIIGKVVFSSVIFGKFVRLISNPLIFGSCIVIPLMIIIFMNIRNMVKDVKEISERERIDMETAELKAKLGALERKKEQENK